MGTRADVACTNPIGNSSNEDPVLSLVEVVCGCPVTVDADSSPFRERPEDLSKNSWYLVHSDLIGVPGLGSWEPKGEPLPVIFLDLPITCLEITRVFHERNNRETNWMMLEYKITTAHGTFSICRIWQDPTNHAQVGGPVPFVDNRHHADDYPVQAAGNPPESDIFSGGDFLELLDLEVPLFPTANSENLG